MRAPELRPFQRESIQALRRLPAHLICVAPTGSGKSLIYETLAAEDRIRTLLITPLVALARQQSERLGSLGLTVALNSEKPVLQPDCWIASPEAALDPALRARWKRWKTGLLVVDECHCLWDWGERFRPAFRSIPALLSELGIRRSAWLTATLPLPARKELLAALPAPALEIGRFDLPPRLRFEARRVPWVARTDALGTWLRAHPDPGLIFVNTRAATDRVARLARAHGRNAVPYHAGLGREERLALESRLRRSDADVWVSTSAFGMGMDHRCLKWVLLWQAPPSLLALTQAVGRAGRDPTEEGHAAVFWDEDDFHLLDWAAQNSPRHREDLQTVRHFLHAPGCRRENLTQYFESDKVTQSTRRTCSICDFCLSHAPEASFKRVREKLENM